MKKLILGLGLAVAGLTCSVASAYDYYQGDCCPAPYNDCYNDCCGSDFDGFYFGGNLGVVTNVAYRNDFNDFNESTTGGSRTCVDTDFTIGLQVGYDLNCGCSLFGLVVDWNWVNIDHSDHSFNDDRHRNGHDWFLTIRGRAGITVCDCLFYLTAGAVVADFDTRWRRGFDDASHHHDDTRWGWVGGFGVEYLLGCNWSVGADILFMHFDEEKHSFTTDGTAPTSFRFGHSDSVYVARVLLNYRFGDLFGCFCR